MDGQAFAFVKLEGETGNIEYLMIEVHFRSICFRFLFLEQYRVSPCQVLYYFPQSNFAILRGDSSHMPLSEEVCDFISHSQC